MGHTKEVHIKTKRPFPCDFPGKVVMSSIFSTVGLFQSSPYTLSPSFLFLPLHRGQLLSPLFPDQIPQILVVFVNPLMVQGFDHVGVNSDLFSQQSLDDVAKHRTQPLSRNFVNLNVSEDSLSIFPISRG